MDVLEKEGIKVRVINNATIKPMDEATIIQAARDAGAVVTVEEHQVQGGMGSAVAEVLAKNYPVPIEFIGVQNHFGESGEPSELIEHFGMGVLHIIVAAKKVISRKKNSMSTIFNFSLGVIISFVIVVGSIVLFPSFETDLWKTLLSVLMLSGFAGILFRKNTRFFKSLIISSIILIFIWTFFGLTFNFGYITLWLH